MDALPPSHPPPLVAVVDDEPHMRALLCAMLAEVGFTAVEFTCGLDAQARIDQGTAVVCLDLGLDDIPGLDVLKHLRAHLPDVPVVVVTARTRVEEVVEAMKLGAYDYLAKPIDELRFGQTLRRAAVHRAMTARVRRLEDALGERSLADTLAAHGPAMREVVRSVERVREADV